MLTKIVTFSQIVIFIKMTIFIRNKMFARISYNNDVLNICVSNIYLYFTTQKYRFKLINLIISLYIYNL